MRTMMAWLPLSRQPLVSKGRDVRQEDAAQFDLVDRDLIQPSSSMM
jgi:hypothetical protein